MLSQNAASPHGSSEPAGPGNTAHPPALGTGLCPLEALAWCLGDHSFTSSPISVHLGTQHSTRGGSKSPSSSWTGQWWCPKLIGMHPRGIIPYPGAAWGITGLPLLLKHHSQLRGQLGCWSLCHAGILPGLLALCPAAGLIFISCFSLFLLSKGRSLCAKGFISLGSSFVSVCFFFNLVSRGHPFYSRESVGRMCLCFWSTKWWGSWVSSGILTGLKQALLPP